MASSHALINNGFLLAKIFIVFIIMIVYSLTFLQLILYKSDTINLSNLLALVSHKLHSYFLLTLNKL